MTLLAAAALCFTPIVSAAGALGAQDDAVDPLIVQLGDADRAIASRAANALIPLGEDAIAPLTAALSNVNPQVRAQATYALGNIRDIRVVRPVARLLRDPDEQVRAYASNALQNLGFAHPLGTVWRASDAIVDPQAAEEYRANNDEHLRGLVVDEVKGALISGHAPSQFAALDYVRRFGPVEALPEVVRCAASDEPTVRSRALTVMARIHDPAVFEPLVEALTDPSADIRLAATSALRNRSYTYRDDTPMVEPLIRALSDEDRRVRIMSAEALGTIYYADNKRAATVPLIDLLKEDDRELLEAAIESLAKLGDKRASDPLFELLQHPRVGDKAGTALAALGDPRAADLLRAHLAVNDYSVINALGALKDRRSVDLLIPLLESEQESLRDLAATALGEIGDRRAVEPLIAALQREKRGQIHSIARALGDLRDPRAVAPLIDTVRLAGQRVWIGRAASPLERDPGQNPVSWPLMHMGGHAMVPLAKALVDESVIVRRVAAWVLYNLSVQGGQDREDMQPAVEALIVALMDPDDAVRHHAAMTLGDMGDSRAVQPLLGVLAAAGDSNEDVYRSASYMNAAAHLSRIRDPASVEPLIELLKHDRAGVRAAAARALAGMRDQRAVPPLLAALRDPDPIVRSNAAIGLGNLKAADAVDPLIARLADNEAAVCVAAAEGLGRLADRRAADSLAHLTADADFELQVAAAIALVRLEDPRGVDAITGCMEDPDREKRERAVTELSSAYLSKAELFEPLREAVSDPSIRVRLFAARALGRVGTPEAVDILISKTSDRENLQSVLQGLSRTGDERVMPVLIRHLDHKDADIRSVAIYEVARLGRWEGVVPLIQRLDDPIPSVQIAAIRSLRTLGASEAIPRILSLTLDDDPNVRFEAERSLAKWPRD